MQKSEKYRMGQARASCLRKAAFRERAQPSWTSSLIGRTVPTPSVFLFCSDRRAPGSHPSHTRSRVASIKCTVLHRLSFFCARSNLNTRPTTSSRLWLTISPTATLRSRPRLEGLLKTTPLFEFVPATTPHFLNPLFSSRLKICTSSVLFLL